jgi:hypothetical protein
MSESNGRLGGIDEIFVNAAELFRAFIACSMVGTMDSLSELEAPPSASYGEDEELILGSWVWCGTANSS